MGGVKPAVGATFAQLRCQPSASFSPGPWTAATSSPARKTKWSKKKPNSIWLPSQCWAVEGECEEHHVIRATMAASLKKAPVRKASPEADLEESGDPGEKQREGNAGRGDVLSGRVHPHEFERCGHQKSPGKISRASNIAAVLAIGVIPFS